MKGQIHVLDEFCVLYRFSPNSSVSAAELVAQTLNNKKPVIAAFVDTVECREMYKQLCAEMHLVYQSPVRLNKNSNNKFFHCVFRGPKCA